MAMQSTTGGILEGILQGVLGAELQRQQRQQEKRLFDTQMQNALARDEALFQQSLRQRAALRPVIESEEEAEYQRKKRRDEESFQTGLARDAIKRKSVRDETLENQQKTLLRVLGEKGANGKRAGGSHSDWANEDEQWARDLEATVMGLPKFRASNKGFYSSLVAGDIEGAAKLAKTEEERKFLVRSLRSRNGLIAAGDRTPTMTPNQARLLTKDERQAAKERLAILKDRLKRMPKKVKTEVLAPTIFSPNATEMQKRPNPARARLEAEIERAENELMGTRPQPAAAKKPAAKAPDPTDPIGKRMQEVLDRMGYQKNR